VHVHDAPVLGQATGDICRVQAMQRLTSISLRGLTQ